MKELVNYEPWRRCLSCGVEATHIRDGLYTCVSCADKSSTTKNMTNEQLLQQAKDQVAKKAKYDTWDELVSDHNWPNRSFHDAIGFLEDVAKEAIQSAREEAAKGILQVKNIGEDEGRAGCTWGDTEYDSLSVAYGFNLCREHAFEIIDSIYKKLTAPGR